jgi:uncharacterized protein YggE
MMYAAAFAAGLSLTGTGAAVAQPMMPPAPPTISVSARGEVQLPPDRARVQVGVETQARTPALASQENNRKQTAILAAIRALGVPAAQIQTLNYSVMPMQHYDEKLRRVVIDGYTVSNVVQVETEKLELAGPIIDAGKAQDDALAMAVASARRQAEVAAKAAGGQIAELIELSINDFERPDPRPMMAMAKMEASDAAMPTPLAEGTTTVAVSVSTRWKFARQP